MQLNQHPEEYCIFFNEFNRIFINKSNLSLYPSSLFYLIDKFEAGNEHFINGFCKDELYKVEYFYENHYWEFLPPRIIIDGTFLSMSDSLDYLGLLFFEEDYYKLFELEYELEYNFEIDQHVNQLNKYDIYDDKYVDDDIDDIDGW
jgi:hypothetical protein